MSAAAPVAPTTEATLGDKLTTFATRYYEGYFEVLGLDAKGLPFAYWAEKSQEPLKAFAVHAKGILGVSPRLRDEAGDHTEQFAGFLCDNTIAFQECFHFIGKLFDTFSAFGKDPLPNGDCFCGSALEDYMEDQLEAYLKLML